MGWFVVLIFLKAIIRTMLAIFLIVLLSLSFPAAVTPARAQSTSHDFSEVDAYINETMRRLPIKGMALAIVKGDEIVYMQGYGIANVHGDPATPQTPWPMASVTKSFTALAIRQLALAGKVDLSAPLQTYLPEFQLSDQHAASSITVRDLLDHTSGISRQEGEAPYLNSPQNTFAEDLDRLADYRPIHPPGEHYEYSNWNYVLLGQVVSRVSGQSYAEYVQANIFAPLGMSHSTFADFHSLPHAATGYLITFGFPVVYDEKYVPAMVGAAYLTSTSEDMAHYLSLFLGEGQYHSQPLLPANGQGSYGPMWYWLEGSPTADTVYGLSGGHNSFSTTCLLYPYQEVGVVLLLNTRLDHLAPDVSSYEIALGIGNIINHLPYHTLASSALYIPWAIMDGSVVLFIAIIIGQIAGLRSWRNRYWSSRRSTKILAWTGIVFNLLLCFGILYLPTLVSTSWNTLLFMRPDIAIPLFVIAIFLGAIGLFKAIKSLI